MNKKLINLAKTLELIGVKKMSKEVMELSKIAYNDASDEIRSSPHFQDYVDWHTSQYYDVFEHMDENAGNIDFENHHDRKNLYLKEGAEDWIKTVDIKQFWKEIEKERIKVIEDLVKRKFKSSKQREYDPSEVYGYVKKKLTEFSKLKASGSPEERAFAEACIYVLRKTINAEAGEMKRTEDKRFELSGGNEVGPGQLQTEFANSVIDSLGEIEAILEEIISNKSLGVKARAEAYRNGYGAIGGWHSSRFGADEVVVRYESPWMPEASVFTGKMNKSESMAGMIEVYSLDENIKFKASDFRPLMEFISDRFKSVANIYANEDGYVKIKRKNFEDQLIKPESTGCSPMAAQRFYYKSDIKGAYFHKYMYLHITNPFAFS